MKYSIYIYISILLLIVNTAYTTTLFCPPDSLLRRSLDGSCNNLLFKEYGKVGTFFKAGSEGREHYPGIYDPAPEVTPTYEDYCLLPSDGPRGNARHISNELATRHHEDAIDMNGHNMLSTMIGQFINHDLHNTRTKNSDVLGHADLKTFILSQDDAACYNNPQVPINPRDYFCFDNDTIRVVGIKPSVGIFDEDETITVYNDASSFLDLDHVYGRTKEIGEKLRSGTGGKMLVTESVDVAFGSFIPGLPAVSKTLENLLPFYEETLVPVDPVFRTLGPEKTVFSAGDTRLNQNMALTFLHTLFVREHNKICDEIISNNILYKLLPRQFDDLIFERARRLNIAKYQHIVYEQYLPTVYGEYFSDKVGDYDSYQPMTDPSTSNLFSNVAFRYGHYTPKSYFALDECGNAISNNVPVPGLKQVFVGFQNPSPMAISAVGRIAGAGGLDNIARGLIEQPVHENYFTIEEILRSFPASAGVFDLGTIDIMRARYNSIPNYQHVRKHYFKSGNETLDNIYGLEDCPASLEHNSETKDPLSCFLHITSDCEKAEKLRTLFSKINNIDAIVGVGLEDHVEGTSFGRTAGHIVVDQFKRSRDGDRFFYKNTIEWLKFTSRERQDIMNTSIGSILRRNLKDSVLEFPDDAFTVPVDYVDDLKTQCSSS